MGGRQPHASVNFITAHDGFTLHDLVSFNEKHNEANGEQSGRSDDNLSWNCGAEGATDDSAILPSANGRREISLPRCCSPREFRCCWRETKSVAHNEETTTAIVRTMKSRGSIGVRSLARRVVGVLAIPDSSLSRAPGFAPPPFLSGPSDSRLRSQRPRLVSSGRVRNDKRRLEQHRNPVLWINAFRERCL